MFGGICSHPKNLWESPHRTCRTLEQYPCYTSPDSLPSTWTCGGWTISSNQRLCEDSHKNSMLDRHQLGDQSLVLFSTLASLLTWYSQSTHHRFGFSTTGVGTSAWGAGVESNLVASSDEACWVGSSDWFSPYGTGGSGRIWPRSVVIPWS